MRQPKHLIFICQNLRGTADPRGSCMARGSAELLARLKGRRAELGLKESLRVMGSTCLGACESGIVALVVGPEGSEYYGRLDTASADALIDERVLRGDPSGELARHRLPVADLLDLSALEGDDAAEAGDPDAGRDAGDDRDAGKVAGDDQDAGEDAQGDAT